LLALENILTDGHKFKKTAILHLTPLHYLIYYKYKKAEQINKKRFMSREGDEIILLDYLHLYILKISI